MLSFDDAERNEKLGNIQCQRSKESSRGKSEYFLQNDSQRQSRPSKVSENRRKGGRWLGRRKLIEFGGDYSPRPEAPPRSKRGRIEREVRGGATEKGRSVGAIEEKEAQRDGSIEYFPWGKEVAFESQKE